MPADPVTIWLAITPPSTNRSRHRHVQRTHTMKKRLQGDIETLLIQAKLPRGLPGVKAVAVMRFPVRRRRDTVNYWLLDKALGDALVNGGWLKDDTPEHYHLRMRFDQESGPARTTITLTPTSVCA